MLLELKNITKTYRKLVVFHNLDFSFQRCGLYWISSDSGKGKSTLLNIIAGYEGFDSGKRVVNDLEIAYIFQTYELLDSLNVQENIMLSKDILNLNNDDFYNQLLDVLSLRELLDYYPNELSIGQKQRVGIARALLKNPQIILCDEPTESLDQENKKKVMKLLKLLSVDHVVIIASHEKEVLERYYDYHYRIEERKLILIDERNSLSDVQINKEKQQKSIKATRYYMRKMMKKKTCILNSIMILFLLTQMLLYQFCEQMFALDQNFNAYNADYIYIDYYSEKENRKGDPILKFDSLNVDGKVLYTYTLPLKKEKNLKENELFINQHTATSLMELWKCEKKDLIGKSLVLTYQLGNEQYAKDMQIVKVVEESDVKSAQLYYSYEVMNKILKKELIEGISAYDYLKEKGNSYCINYDIDEIQSQYEVYKQNPNLDVYHSIFTFYESDSRGLYRLVFNAIQLLLCLGVICYSLYYAVQCTKKDYSNMAVIYSSGAELSWIKRIYFLHKLNYLCVGITLLLIEIILYRYLYSNSTILVSIVYLFVVSGMYVLCMVKQVRAFNERNIALILKENKD